MAMMCAGIDSDRIRLIGRWRSDKMYQYLHVQAQAVMSGVAAATTALFPATTIPPFSCRLSESSPLPSFASGLLA